MVWHRNQKLMLKGEKKCQVLIKYQTWFGDNDICFVHILDLCNEVNLIILELERELKKHEGGFISFSTVISVNWVDEVINLHREWGQVMRGEVIDVYTHNRTDTRKAHSVATVHYSPHCYLF